LTVEGDAGSVAYDGLWPWKSGSYFAGVRKIEKSNAGLFFQENWHMSLPEIAILSCIGAAVALIWFSLIRASAKSGGG
jgi:hypothetical protein